MLLNLNLDRPPSLTIWLQFPVSERTTGSSVFHEKAEQAVRIQGMLPHGKVATLQRRTRKIFRSLFSEPPSFPFSPPLAWALPLYVLLQSMIRIVMLRVISNSCLSRLCEGRDCVCPFHRWQWAPRTWHVADNVYRKVKECRGTLEATS